MERNMRIKLTVAYDGTNYNGFQCQTNGVAIQDVLNGAISDLFGTPIRTIGASRTDAGVHAEGNVAVFDVETRIHPSKIAFALNARLPEDIRVVESERVPDDFHPRYQTTYKTYEYHILNRVHPDPLFRHTEMHVYYPLDAQKMNTAAQYLIGEHDFASFCSSGNSTATTVRTITDASVTRTGDRLVFRIRGNGFLYNMVRIIVGTLLYIGDGRWEPERMRTIIEARDRHEAGPTAIPKGLVLVGIEYPDYVRGEE
ncbi:MAG: tRNA pseudouridine(38-40) synthase TruA [Eubacteriales bacterium]|jgi:tRNA pseudouridine38-40 synthase|nr:tRNA pseudouridine(38-40) synthase TruA [Eubacteriales bacterium]